ncbi:MAG: hypothetical protein RBS24_00790 [Bacilli bacterium]|nr:hypothetical protein [Bacilli bacterium]
MKVTNSFALQLTNGAEMTNYLGLNENLISDQLHTLSSINSRSSWKITFNGSEAVIIMVMLVDFISSSLRKKLV